MRSEMMEIEAGFYQCKLDPGNAERFVLRFPAGELLVSPSPGSEISLEVDIQGSAEDIRTWQPSIRKREGLFVIADEMPARARVVRASITVPGSFRDLELHTASGTIDARSISVDVLATSESGDIRIEGAREIEASSVSGSICLSDCASARAHCMEGSIRCEDSRGHIVIENQSGEVSIVRAGGNVVVISDSGDVEVSDPRGRLRIVTKTGDVSLELSSPFAGGEVNTGEGDVSVSISGGEIELRCETLAGTINAPGCSVSSTSGPRRCALHLGRGGKRLHVKSVEGDVEVMR